MPAKKAISTGLPFAMTCLGENVGIHFERAFANRYCDSIACHASSAFPVSAQLGDKDIFRCGAKLMGVADVELRRRVALVSGNSLQCFGAESIFNMIMILLLLITT